MKHRAKFWVAVALILCLVSSLGASLFQTNFGKIEYHDMTFVTASGHELDALLLVPKNATAEKPAPARTAPRLINMEITSAMLMMPRSPSCLRIVLS